MCAFARVRVCMYLCMYVCACMYVCMYVCMVMQVPQCDDLILCVTDPLTFSDMKRYFNSFAPLKW